MMAEVLALAKRDLVKWSRARYALVISFITPFFWLTLFGSSLNISGLFRVPIDVPAPIAQAFSEIAGRIVIQLFGTHDYFTYLAAGMLAVFILFTTMFNGMSLVWDRRFGFLNRLLVAPIRRESIFLSRVISGVVRSLIQVTVIFAISTIFGLGFGQGFSPAHVLGVLFALALLALGLASIFTAMATAISSHETLFAISNLVNLPLMFTSNALFPIRQMPFWLQGVANVNPITYAASTIRSLILANSSIDGLIPNYAYLTIFALSSLFIGALVSRRTLGS